MTLTTTAGVASSRTDTYQAVCQFFDLPSLMTSKVLEFPAKYIPQKESWMWSPAFLAMLDESRADIAAGKYIEFSTVDDLLEELDSE